jgi:hypothetical protein
MTFDIDYSSVLPLKYMLLLFGEAWLFVIVAILSTINWNDVLGYFSKKAVRLKDSFPLYAKANIGKYLPGNVGHYVSRQVFGVSLGVTQKQLVISAILEIWYSACSAFLLSVVLGWNQILDVLRGLFPNVNIVLSFAIFLAAGIVVLTLLYVILRKTKFFSDLVLLVQDRTFRFLLAKTVLRAVLCSLINGVMLVIIMRMNVPLDFSSIVTVVTASAVSWLIGFVTPGAPGGIGVRESVLLFMLSPYFPAEIVLTSSVVCRLAMVLGDVFTFLLGLFVKNVKSA